ncbi:uncharacterized protein LOC135812950 [Sycon ciliatum]|uniref:uncharacterized protein LOC135812950 n=1 Tax=Sycon ciliatum TaxID=27933 RepID=UPI0031F6BD51
MRGMPVASLLLSSLALLFALSSQLRDSWATVSVWSAHGTPTGKPLLTIGLWQRCPTRALVELLPQLSAAACEPTGKITVAKVGFLGSMAFGTLAWLVLVLTVLTLSKKVAVSLPYQAAAGITSLLQCVCMAAATGYYTYVLEARDALALLPGVRDGGLVKASISVTYGYAYHVAWMSAACALAAVVTMGIYACAPAKQSAISTDQYQLLETVIQQDNPIV